MRKINRPSSVDVQERDIQGVPLMLIAQDAVDAKSIAILKGFQVRFSDS